MDTLEKKTKVKELWQLCFHDDERFVNLLFDNLYRDENTVCFEKGGEVTTALQMLPYRMSFGETSLDVSYISGAATRPEYRNRGLMGRLLKESFEIMRSRNRGFMIIMLRRVMLLYFSVRNSIFHRRIDFMETDIIG